MGSLVVFTSSEGSLAIKQISKNVEREKPKPRQIVFDPGDPISYLIKIPILSEKHILVNIILVVSVASGHHRLGQQSFVKLCRQQKLVVVVAVQFIHNFVVFQCWLVQAQTCFIIVADRAARVTRVRAIHHRFRYRANGRHFRSE